MHIRQNPNTPVSRVQYEDLIFVCERRNLYQLTLPRAVFHTIVILVHWVKSLSTCETPTEATLAKTLSSLQLSQVMNAICPHDQLRTYLLFCAPLQSHCVSSHLLARKVSLPPVTIATLSCNDSEVYFCTSSSPLSTAQRDIGIRCILSNDTAYIGGSVVQDTASPRFFSDAVSV
jgi:hypothetical protein